MLGFISSHAVRPPQRSERHQRERMLCDAAVLRLKPGRRLRMKTNESRSLSSSQRLIDVKPCGYTQPCSLADWNKQQGVLCYCRSFTPGCYCPMLLNPPLTHSFSHLVRPRLNRDESGRTTCLSLFIFGTQNHRADKDLLSLLVRLDLQ